MYNKDLTKDRSLEKLFKIFCELWMNESSYKMFVGICFKNFNLFIEYFDKWGNFDKFFAAMNR